MPLDGQVRLPGRRGGDEAEERLLDVGGPGAGQQEILAGPKETRIDMRSASRQGRSDLGVNRARILDFLNRLNERLGGAYKPKMQKLDEEQHAH